MIIWYCKEPTVRAYIYTAVCIKNVQVSYVSASRPFKRQRKIIRRSSSTSDHNNITTIMACVILNKCIIINTVTATAYTNNHLYRGHYMQYRCIRSADKTTLYDVSK